MTPHEFVQKWRSSTSTERQVYQQHFLDLCRLVGHPAPAELDPQNQFFTFEAGAAKAGGGQGFADVWYKGHFAVEYKGPHGDLAKAYVQLLQYRESLENPPLLVVSNIQTLVIHTNFTGTAKRVVTIALDDLLTAGGLQALRNLFYNPEAFRPEKTAAQVTEEAAQQFGTLAAHLGAQGHHPHAVAHYLIRLLFCLFAEDIDLLPRALFTRLVERGRRDPQLFNRQIKLLFGAMAEGDAFGEHQIRYFDGGLFDGDVTLPLDAAGLAILHGITELDWAAIEPAIFGTLFTRSLDPQQRAKLGAQYTSKEDILLIVEPVLMAPLRREWAAVQAAARDLAARRSAPATTGAVRTRLQNELSGRVQGYAQQLANTRIWIPRAGAATSSTSHSACSSNSGKKSPSSPAKLASPSSAPSPASPPPPSSSTASKSTTTPTNSPRPPSGSATSSGSTPTASASPKNPSSSPSTTSATWTRSSPTTTMGSPWSPNGRRQM
jgi:hypothetical protein